MTRYLTLTASALVLAMGLGTAHAQQGTMMNQGGAGMMQGQAGQGPAGQGRADDDERGPQDAQPGRYGGWGMMPWGYGRGMGPGMMDDDDWSRMMGGYGMGPGMMGGYGYGPGMMGRGFMGRGFLGPRMMIIMMDTNGDGKLSLQEFQAIHERMFKALDENGDGQLTPDELQQGSNDGDDR